MVSRSHMPFGATQLHSPASHVTARLPSQLTSYPNRRSGSVADTAASALVGLHPDQTGAIAAGGIAAAVPTALVGVQLLCGCIRWSRRQVTRPALRMPAGRNDRWSHDRRGGAGNRRGFDWDIPGVSLVQDLWSRRLRASALLCAVLILMWCLQGLGGLAKLKAFNDAQLHNGWLGGTEQLSLGDLAGSWLFGIHPMDVSSVPITVSDLELDFGMDVSFLRGASNQLHRLLTSCFLHCGVIHLGFNVGYLASLAPLEVDSPALFIVVFLLAGIGGNAAFVTYGNTRRALGASGGICGIIGYELISLARQRRRREFSEVSKQMFGLLVIGLLLPGVCNSAHIGGLVTGIVVAVFCGRRSAYRRALVPWYIVLIALLLISPLCRQFVIAMTKALPLAVMRPGALFTQSATTAVDGRFAWLSSWW